MNSMKETASNIAASAKAGMEKTKATVEEKVEKMTSRDPVQKQMATEKKEERIRQAELEKQEVRQHNAVAKNTCTDGGYTAAGTGAYTTGATHTYSTTGEYGQPTGAHQMSALPGHGTGQPAGQLVDARTEAHPIGSTTGVAGAKSHNTRVEGNPHGYETGGTYS